MNMHRREWSPVILLFVLAIVGSTVHCLWAAIPEAWARVLTNLYYLPIVVAAVRFGPKAALGVALAAGACCAIASAASCGDPWLQVLGETMLFNAVGLMTGKLAEWRPFGSRVGRGVFPRYAAQDLERSFKQLRGASEMPALAQMEIGLVRQFLTPVASIEGASWVLEDLRLPDEKREEFVGIIRKESHRLDRALANLLNFTQPQNPRYRKVDLALLINAVIHLARPAEHGPYFLFRTDIAYDLPLLQCDPEQVRRMLLNIVMNSIEATPGGGEIAIAAHADGDDVVIEIKDHGRGIGHEILDRVYDPFFTTRDNGLGLGLAIARQVAAAHGGKIAVENTSCKGTSVSIKLPLNGAGRS
jgi:signal transduction histidine kinase